MSGCLPKEKHRSHVHLMQLFHSRPCMYHRKENVKLDCVMCMSDWCFVARLEVLCSSVLWHVFKICDIQRTECTPSVFKLFTGKDNWRKCVVNSRFRSRRQTEYWPLSGGAQCPNFSPCAQAAFFHPIFSPKESKFCGTRKHFHKTAGKRDPKEKRENRKCKKGKTEMQISPRDWHYHSWKEK